MEYSIGLDPETGTFHILINGLIDSTPIREAIHQMVRRSDWHDGSNVIVDHRNQDNIGYGHGEGCHPVAKKPNPAIIQKGIVGESSCLTKKPRRDGP